MKSKMVVPTQPVVEVVARVCRESPEKESLAGGEHKQDGKMVDYVLPGRGIKLILFDCKIYVLPVSISNKLMFFDCKNYVLSGSLAGASS